MAWFQDGQGNNREVNDPETQCEIGDKYYDGDEVPLNYKEAVKWYQLAADQGDAEGQGNLGRMYADGEGVDRDYLVALKWIRLSARQGFPNAQFNLGLMYESGEGVAQDYEEAIKWYRLAANQGFPNAQYSLACMYYNGQGVKQDYSETIKWCRLAANLGFPEAQYTLGTMYDNGDGVKQDYLEALKWYRAAAEQGYSDAQNDIGAMYVNGQGVKQDYSEAIKWYRLAAEQSNSQAQFNLGSCYLFGLYYPPDIVEALTWFRKSADQDHIEAKRYSDHILKVQTELDSMRNQIEPRYFKVAQLLLQIPRISTDITEMWGWLEKGKRPSKKEANKFFLTCILDYQIKVEFVWSNTKKFVEQTLGDPENLWGFILGHTLDDWKQKKKEYGLHWKKDAHERVWKIGRDVMRQHRGDARAIWEGQEPAAVLVRLHQLGDGKYGVGEIIANMIVGALIDTEQIKGVGDVKADTHVRKILGRVFRGYNFGTDEARECTEFARKIYPKNPWLLDQPLYFLGKDTCKEKDPGCPNCFLRQECMYLKKQSLT